MRSGPVGDLLAGQPGVTGRGGGVYGEHHGGEVALAVVVRDLLDCWRALLSALKYLADAASSSSSRDKPAMTIRLDVHMHIDPLQGGRRSRPGI